MGVRSIGTKTIVLIDRIVVLKKVLAQVWCTLRRVSVIKIECPILLHCRRCQTRRPGCFFDGEAAEKPQLDDATLLRIEFRQLVKGVVQSEIEVGDGGERVIH
jgi:hypothetical protein